MIITPEQIRAARALLRLEQDDLARRAQVSVATVRRLEAADGAGRVAPATLDGVRRRPGRPDAAARFRDLQAISVRSAAALVGQEPVHEAELYDEAGLPA